MVENRVPFSRDFIERIVAEYPTPFHIYDEQAIRENARRLEDAFRWVPDRAGRPVFANEVRGCEMAADPVWLEPMAHRSLESAPFRAAAAVENRTEGDLVTFVSVASSGAEIERGLLDPQHDWQAGGQLEEVARTVGNKPIDTLLVSIGGNDVGFSTGLKSLAADPLDWFRETVESDTAAAIRELRGAYDRLAGAIDDLDPESVLLTEYPTAHFDRGGGRVGDGCGVFEGISHNDAIAIKRLELDPAVPTCIHCAAKG